MSLVALDLGASRAVARIESRSGTYDRTFRLPARATGRGELASLLLFVRACVAHAASPPAAIAVAAAPRVDEQGRVESWPNRPHWVGLPLGARLEDDLACRVVITDDGVAATLAEGEQESRGTLLHVRVGTGVGAGVLVKDRVRTGGAWPRDGLGHVVVEPTGPRCRCGRRGCVQAIASVPAMVSEASRRRGRRVDVTELAVGATGEHEWAVDALAAAARALRVLVDFVSVSFPVEVVTVGGPVLQALPQLVELLDVELARERPGSVPVVSLARHWRDGPVVGAMRMARSLGERDNR